MGSQNAEEEKKQEELERFNKLYAGIKPMSAYKDAFVAEMKQPKKRIETGILSIDKALNGGLQDELYIMGAETSTGKSAIMMWMAQHIAKQGIDVLYIALEMGKNEYVARGSSAISFEKWIDDPETRKFTAGDILYWTYDASNPIEHFSRVAYSQYESYVDEYFKRYGDHLHIIEGGMDGLCAKDVGNLAAIYKKKTGHKPVVFVDYLQLLKADPNDRSQTDRKTKIDTSVKVLKTLASQEGMPVFTISSISRVAYNGRVSSASFKESGDTEYTGGVLLGWNWNGVTDEKDDDKREEEKVKCYNQGYRIMSMQVLKSRNSERDQDILLRYYPAYSYFADENDWQKVPDTELPLKFQRKYEKNDEHENTSKRKSV